MKIEQTEPKEVLQGIVPLTEQLRPMDKLAGFSVRPGLYEMNGATALAGGAVNFTIHSHNATSCQLLLYHRDESTPYAVLPFPENYKIGKSYSMIVFDLNIEEFEYAYRLNGPWYPEKGLLFDPSRPILDPYAKAVTGQSVWGEKQQKEGLYRARVVKNNYDWGDIYRPQKSMSDLIIYELHVRGFTRHASSGVQNPGTFDGLREKIPYLKELGVTAIEMMPIFEFDETLNMRVVDGQVLLDYWGYNTVSFFAPNTSYSAANEYNREGRELKDLIRELHENGMEVILDVVFNHTAEGNEDGHFINFKGIDNNIYYMLTPDGHYFNFSGCGNTLNCNHPIVQQMIVECLRYWVTDYHVDGFRFDLASILGRNEDGSPMNNPPLLERLAFDPILGNAKLIAEAWDAGGLYQVGSFPAWKRWAEWNGKYRDCLRSYLKGEYWMAWEAGMRIAGSPDLYTGDYVGYNSSVNFLTCHDGFTLRDLYSYNEKHNLANGWNNTDGANDNRSWNCGVEGDTDEPEILALRQQLVRNACAVLMCSRGTPMFLAGDEFGNTQYGNNNAYCQDNEISWLDWSLLEKNRSLFSFFKYMIAFRKRHPVIRRELPPARSGFPSVSFYTAEGQVTEESKSLGVLYAGFRRDKNQDELIYLAINPHWETQRLVLPHLAWGGYWQLVVDTSEGENAVRTGTPKQLWEEMWLAPRSVCVLTGHYEASEPKNE